MTPPNRSTVKKKLVNQPGLWPGFFIGESMEIMKKLAELVGKLLAQLWHARQRQSTPETELTDVDDSPQPTAPPEPSPATQQS
jgi:hypothetical protein